MKRVIFIFCFLSFFSCVKKPVITELPLKKVILYRNGIGYFEREGKVNANYLYFKVKKDYLNDFLSSLAVATKGVPLKSIEFKIEEKDMVTVKVGFAKETKNKKIRVAYSIESPIWRPSYRIIFEDNQAILQAWAVIQNITGEDWKGIKLVLTTGAPLTFKTDLSTPIIPPRVEVTDSGEVILGVVKGESSLPGSALPKERPKLMKAMLRKEAPPVKGYEYQFEDKIRLEEELPRKEKVEEINYFSSLLSMAEKREEKGVTVYVIKGKVDIPDKSSTMVPILNKVIEAEDAFMYRPDSSVPDSYKYPFRVVRLKNTTGAYLERGSVMVYGGGRLIGQGILDPLPKGAKATIPIALDRSIKVETKTKYIRAPMRLVKIVNGVITVEERSQRKTTYEIVNGKREKVKLYVKHPRHINWEIVSPKITEKVVGGVLIEKELIPDSTAELEIIEESPIRRNIMILDKEALKVIKGYLTFFNIPERIRVKLRKIVEKRENLAKIEDKIDNLNQKLKRLKEISLEIRENLRAIKGNPKAINLRNRLTKKLEKISKEIEELTVKLVDLDDKKNELERELLQEIKKITIENE